MKKTLKVVLSFLLCILMCGSIYAYSNSIEGDHLLVSYGYPVNIVENMDPAYKAELIDSLKDSPEQVQVVSGTLRVSLLEELLVFLATPDSEYLNSGVSEEILREKRIEIGNILDSGNEAIEECLGLNSREIEVLDEFLNGGKVKSVEEIIQEFRQARGTISEADMNFYVTVADKSSGGAIKYNINITFAWNTPYYIDLYSDKIAVVWGGDLLEDNISSGTVTYYTFEKPSTWKEVWKLTSMTLESEIPNQSLEFSFLQSRDGLAQAKHGTVSFSLSRNNTQGENTYVIARYGHKILALTGGSIDIDGITPSFGTGYDQTNIEAGKVAIKY